MRACAYILIISLWRLSKRTPVLDTSASHEAKCIYLYLFQVSLTVVSLCNSY